MWRKTTGKMVLALGLMLAFEANVFAQPPTSKADEYLKKTDGAKGESPGDPEFFKEGQKAMDIAAKREEQFKKLCEDFARSLEKAPRQPLNLKEEKLLWDRLDKIIEMLSEDCDNIIKHGPKFKTDHALLMAAYENAIKGLENVARICNADAKNEKEDGRKEDYLVLGRISEKCIEKMRVKAKEAGVRKLEVEKLVSEAERDRNYFFRASQVIKLVKQPLEQEIVADEFLKRIQRYQERREQFRKLMRGWSDKLDETPPPGIKVSSTVPPVKSGKLETQVAAATVITPEACYRAGLAALDKWNLAEARGEFSRIVHCKDAPDEMRERAQKALNWIAMGEKLPGNHALQGKVTYVTGDGLILIRGLGEHVGKGDLLVVKRTGFPAMMEVKEVLGDAASGVIVGPELSVGRGDAVAPIAVAAGKKAEAVSE